MSANVIDRPKIDRSTLSFVPELVYFEPSALDYPKGKRIFEWVKEQGIP
ncbi:spore photoproduct lyase family protein, partial [Paenibacillus sp. MCAF20]